MVIIMIVAIKTVIIIMAVVLAARCQGVLDNDATAEFDFVIGGGGSSKNIDGGDNEDDGDVRNRKIGGW